MRAEVLLPRDYLYKHVSHLQSVSLKRVFLSHT